MFQNPVEVLNVRSGELRATASTSGRYLALPDSFLRMRRLRLELSGASTEIRYMAPEQMNFTEGTGKPAFFTVTSQIEFDRTPDVIYTVEMQYVGEFTALSS